MGHNNSLEPIMEQFKTLREEIHLRVRQHTQLVIFKIVSVGALASFLVQSSDSWKKLGATDSGLLLWFVPLSAIIFDMLIAGNLRTLYNIGPYIKKYIEPHFRGLSFPEARFWEESVATASGEYHGYKVIDIIVIWVITILAVGAVSALRWHLGLGLFDWLGLVIVLGGAIMALWLMVRSITMQRTF